MDQRQEGREQQRQQDGGDEERFDKIREPEPRRDRAEPVFLLDDEVSVEAEGDVEQDARPVENAEEQRTRPDRVEIQGPDLAGQPREDACEQHGQQEDVVCERSSEWKRDDSTV